MTSKANKLMAIAVACAAVTPGFAAHPVDLNGKDVSFLRTFSSPFSLTTAAKGTPPNFQEIHRAVDFNGTLHVRVKQTHDGYPVWGGDAVIHIPHGEEMAKKRGFLAAATEVPSTMNGTAYADLQKDLVNTPVSIFTSAQAEKAMTQAIRQYQSKKGNKSEVIKQKSQLIVYVDENQKAHWAFYVRLYVKNIKTLPAIPVFIMDAVTFSVYATWNDMRTHDDVDGGGFGGNLKMGKLSYGLKGGLSKLNFQRDAETKLCYLQNSEVTVSDYRLSEDAVVSFLCQTTDKEHNDLYWDGDADRIHGAYSPNNDALYAGKVINEMYVNWYHVFALTKNNQLQVMAMVTHSPNIDDKGESDPNNAYWDTEKERMYFGDGQYIFYPLTSLGVAAHEISHGFTQQHAMLSYQFQSGGIDESFSDMAAKAAEFYAYGKNDWEIGAEIVKTNLFSSLRSMDQPSKDCIWLHQLGLDQCSIDNAKDYDSTLDVHYTSGVYNRAFYLLATTEGWNTRKAFDVMVQANQYYWTPITTFISGACGVISAAKDYQYDTRAVIDAFNTVGVSTETCK